MHYVSGGRGEEVVVLLHGWPETWYGWVEIMPELARDYTVLAVDLPALGDSRGRLPSYDKKTLARYVHRLVADELGYRRVHLVGHDFGAAVAFAYAAFHRESAETVTLMDYPLASPTVDDQLLQAQLWWFGFHRIPELPEQMVNGRQHTYFTWFFDTLTAPHNRIEPQAVSEFVRAYCRPGALHAGFELYRTRAIDKADNASLTDDRLTLPIMAMAPVRSNDPEHEKRQLQETMRPMAQGPISVQLVPGSGHFLPEEHPEAVTAHLRQFLSSFSTRSSGR